MHANSITCPVCNQRMCEGFLIDRLGEFQQDNLFWASGRFGSYMLGHEQVHPVTTWRCESCGLLQCYAGPTAKVTSDASQTPLANTTEPQQTEPQQVECEGNVPC